MSKINILNDGGFDIATGKHRREINWKNKEIQWSDFVKKVSETHRTAETFKEYMAAKKSRQDEIKDIGGFVGGYLNSGRRKNGNVVHRQLITLDIDFAEATMWEDFTFIYGNAACLYSTHKHCSDSPRYRLILPLDRPVFAEEYQAIARRIAENLGIDNFDHTTFQPLRLMYWPSTSKDGDFEFQYQDGDWLCADDVLNTYRDWKDSSEWPMCTREDKFVQYGIKKQGDPLEKVGIVGAFCRTYTVTEAIELFLSDEYDSCDIEDRYTYKNGSTAGGLVLYEDKYAYSHHGTDPVSGKLCNAFDLVRIHKYGLNDEDVKEGTPGNRLPSFVAMLDFCTKDPKVRMQLGSERVAEAKNDFDIIEDTVVEDDQNDDWMAELDVDKKGNYRSTIDNIITVLNNDRWLKDRFALDMFAKREVALKNLPWREITKMTRYLIDSDDAAIRHYFEKIYGITGVQKVKDAMDIVVQRNKFHPVKNYLKSLVWDGIGRVEDLFIDYMGVEDSPYTRAVTRKSLAAGAARIFDPGCKFDYVPVLVGMQGKKKSMLFDKLGKDWFSDSFGTVQGKEAYEQIQGVWLVEMAELSGLKKADVETIKHFITKREDRFRVAYGRRTENFPRQCIFFGTSNNKDFLRDPTGNRRFWPLDIYQYEPIKDIAVDLNGYEVDQIWAEAVQLYKQGEKLYLPPEIELLAADKQEEHSERDERMGLVQAYLNKLLPDNWDEMDVYQRRDYLRSDDELKAEGKVQRSRVCVAEIWCEVLGGMQKEMTRFNTKDLHDLMRKMPGWEEYETKIRFKDYGVQRGYIRTENWKSNIGTKLNFVASNFEDDIL